MGPTSARRPCGRRKFVKTVAGAATAVLGGAACGGGGTAGSTSPPTSASPSSTNARGPRAALANPFVGAGGRPILVSVEGRDFGAMLDAGLQALGGLDRLISRTSGVLINPNFNMAEPYPGISRASSVVSLVERVRASTSGRVVVADEGYDTGATVYAYLGLYDLVTAAGGEVESFGEFYPVRREDWPDRVPDFEVYTHAYDSPILLSLCNVKRHFAAGFSCAMKNNVGTVTGAVASGTRDYLHVVSDDFRETLVQIAGLLHPELFVVDAQQVLTQRGPSVHDGVPVEANRLVLCGDMLATDAYCNQMLRAYDPGYTGGAVDDQLRRAAELGLGQPDLAQVEIREITA